jgi:uncharacterized protein YlxW (UPF0749 family)
MADRMAERGRTTVAELVRQPLLERLTREALDDDYRVAAERRSARGGTPEPGGGPVARGRKGLTVVVVVAVFGMLAATAFVQTSRSAAANDANRRALIRQVEDGRQDVADQQEEAANLRESNAELTRSLQDLGETAQTVLARNRRQRATTGFLGVTGEGVRVTVEDAPGDDPNQVVKQEDLELLVNALWQAGAEAISINGQRLSTLSPIASSGFAIEVQGVGIASPYTVLAIGDSRALEARFFETSSGLQFDAIANQFGFSYRIDNAGRLEIPGRSERQLVLRSAEVIEPDTPPGKDPES